MARPTPWNVSKGIAYDEDELASLDKNQLLSKFDLDWNVTLNPIHVYMETGEYVELDKRFATVRDDKHVIEVVGSRYKVTQNAEFIDLLAEVRKRGLAEFAAGGYINGGSGVYVVMKLNQNVTIADDPHAPYLIARTSHDGSCSLVVAPLVMRIRCTNAITRQLMNANVKYTKKHTLYSTLNVDDLISKINLAKHSITNYESIANKLIESKFDDQDFESLMVEQFSIPAHILTVSEDMLSRGDKIIRNRMLSYRNFARTAWYSRDEHDTQSNIYGTRYGAFQAIVEAVDHRGNVMNERQANKILLDDDSSLKAKALRLISIGV
jgi:phage/plasmid-like protein (TIGR03299 family)